MARSLNKVMLIGNLTRDPNLRYTPTGTAVCSFGVATNRSWTPADGGERQERVEFHNIVSWAKLAEICGQLLKKGSKVFVEGRLQTRDWKTEEGQDRRTTEVVIDNMLLLNSPRGSEGGYDESYKGSEPEVGEVSSDDSGSSKKSAKSAAPKAKTKGKKATKTKKEAESVDDVADDIPF